MRICRTGPSDGPEHRLSRIFMTDRILRAFVERHEDITAQRELDIDRRLRGKYMRVAIEMGVENDAIFGDLTNPRQAEHLESTRVSEDGSRPGHKAMQSAKLTNQLMAGAEVEMVRIAKNDARVELIRQIALGKPLDR